jgi:hypothetical protein
MIPKPKNKKEQWWKDTKFYDGVKKKMKEKGGKKYATSSEE